MARRVNWPSYSSAIKRWFYGFLAACVFGALIFALPGTLPLFGIGATAAGNVAAVCAFLKLNILMAVLGPLGTLGAVAGFAPAILLVTGIIKGFIGTINLFIDLVKGDRSMQESDVYVSTLNTDLNLPTSTEHRLPRQNASTPSSSHEELSTFEPDEDSLLSARK